jgi:hypothetical protein
MSVNTLVFARSRHLRNKPCWFKLNPLVRLSVLGALTLLAILTTSTPGSATIGSIVKSDLQGSWQIALRGNTGCGFVSMLANVTLNSAGSGTGTLVTHGQCGDSTLAGQSFTIISLAPNGKGTAGLSCGSGCGWTFNIEVSPDRSKFNLTDVASFNPGNFLEGVAILTSPDDDIVTPDLAGSWQATLYGLGGCGVGTSVVTFTLNSSGVATNATETSHSAGCGNNKSTGNTFAIQSLNSNGSGTANLSCGSDCGFNFNIQVSPDRSTINLVDVSTANPGNFLAGTAIRSSSFGDISKANLTGPWQLALYGQGGCGDASTLVTFSLPASGVTSNATEVGHTSGCGDHTSSGNTFTIQTLNANGSGTANLTCGPSCGFNLNIQVSPDRSSFNVVDVSSANPGNYQIGSAIHQ